MAFYRTKDGGHYHIQYGCFNATILCGTQGLEPCSLCTNTFIDKTTGKRMQRHSDGTTSEYTAPSVTLSDEIDRISDIFSADVQAQASTEEVKELSELLTGVFSIDGRSLSAQELEDVLLRADEMLQKGIMSKNNGQYAPEIPEVDDIATDLKEILLNGFDWKHTLQKQHAPSVQMQSEKLDYIIPEDFTAPSVSQEEIQDTATQIANHLHALFAPLGRIDGKQAIEQMRAEGNTQWRQTEWPGWYVEHVIARDSDALNGTSTRCDITKETTNNKVHIDWDTGKFLCDTKCSGIDVKDAWLNDVEATFLAVKRDGVVFFACVESEYEMDDSWEFYYWHKKISNSKSHRTENTRQRKKAFRPLRIDVYALTADDLRSLESKTSQDPFCKDWQGHNSGKSQAPRYPKIKINFKAAKPVTSINIESDRD